MIQAKELQALVKELHEANTAISSIVKKLFELIPDPLEEVKKDKNQLILEARAILGTKVTAEAQELIRSFGVQNLSKVELADFDELIARAKELTDASK